MLALLFQDFPQKNIFLESVAFQHEKYCLANFPLDLDVCLVNKIISINKYLVDLFWISFNEIFKSLSSMTLTILLNLLIHMQYVTYFLRLYKLLF